MAETIKVDGKEYAVEDLSDKARVALTHLQLVEQKIIQNKQDLVILQTARNTYAASLKQALINTEE